jgi:undecaprenyl-diphosphatase
MKINRNTIVSLGILIGILITAGLAFATLAEDLVNQESMSLLDPLFGNWLLLRTTLTGNRLFSLITFMGNTLIISGGTVLIGLWLTKEKHWSQLRLLLATVGGAALLNVVLKNIFLRSRPDNPLAFIRETGFSFPSGHAMVSIAFYGVLVFLIFPNLKSWVGKTLLIIGWIALFGLIGFSRLYLGVHYLTDVLAGWSAGLMWLLLCVLVNKLLFTGNSVQDCEKSL